MRNASSVPHHYRPPQGAKRCIDKCRTREMLLDARNTSTRGVRAQYFSKTRSTISRYTRSCLYVSHGCFHAYSMRSGWPYCTIPQRTRTEGAVLAICLVRSTRFQRFQLSHPHSAVVRVTQADSRGLQRRQLAPYCTFTQALVVHPQSGYLSLRNQMGYGS